MTEIQLIAIYCFCDDFLKGRNHQEWPNIKMTLAEVMFVYEGIILVKRVFLLTYLNLHGCNQIQDFSFLQSLIQLSGLILYGCNQIRDISFLQLLIYLTWLNLGHCI